MAMKTSYTAEIDKKAVPWDEQRRNMSPDELKAARARHLLDESRDAERKDLEKEVGREIEAFIEQVRREITMRSALAKKLEDTGEIYSDIVFEIDAKKMTANYQILRRPSEKIRQMMDADATTFMSNIPLWEGCTPEQRREAMKKHATSLDPQLAELGTIDPLDFLPAASKQWVLDWQQAINTGAAFAVSPQVEYVAHSTIKRGYCLVAPNAIAHPETEHHEKWIQPGRDDMEPGSAGTPSFVRAMMGQRWLDWLLANEQTAIEA